MKHRAANAIKWVLNKDGNLEAKLPGLHFGSAGIAVAIAEAVSGRLINFDDSVDKFILSALSGKLDWPDITHGAAGQGIAALYCADRLRHLRLLDPIT
jgi:hypothetical protein